MIYYFVCSKKAGFCCENYSFLSYDDVGRFLFENQSHNGYDKLQIFRVEKRESEGEFTIYLFNQFVFPDMENLLESMSVFFNVPSKDITLCFFSDGGEHD